MSVKLLSVQIMVLAHMVYFTIFIFPLQCFFMVTILLTGNYNFFNLLTAVLCLSLMDDNFIRYWMGKKQKGMWNMCSLIV